MSNILDTIDGAIEDWETSDDAMRWRPPAVETVQMVGPYRVVTVAEGNTLRVRLEFDAHLYADAMARVRDAMEHLARTFAGLTYTIDEARLETPRERALRLRQERGHGPEVPLDRRQRALT